MPRPKPVDGGWEDHHPRITFYCDVEVAAAIEDAMALSGRSKTQVIVDALREHLAVPRGRHRATTLKQPPKQPPLVRKDGPGVQSTENVAPAG